MAPQPAPPATNLRRMDPKIWRACAGNSVEIPTVRSRVYYFPQGHAEQSSTPITFASPLVLSKPLILCQITAVHFFADPITDEVYAKLVLQPFSFLRSHLPEPPSNQFDQDDEEDKILSFAKILTASDANNGGGFSVPRYCADLIFPPLNYQVEPPVQNLSITDVHGVVWEFRHIYRGTPRRHLLTTGWSKFVNHKKLVSGDSVVFMKNPRGQMFVGVRRAVRVINTDCTSRWSSQIGGTMRTKVVEDNGCGGEGFSRSGRGKLSAEAVQKAAELAAQGMPFEVVYYPRAGWSDFVVKADLVEEALDVCWTPGMRVKMAMETEDSRTTWFQGSVAAAAVPDGHWRLSPWRMLQVTWDEPDVLQNATTVSPWQVEFVSPSTPLHTVYPPAKRLRTSQKSGPLTDGEGDFSFHNQGFSNSTMGHLNQSLLNYNNFPAGMQGARQNLFFNSSLSNFLSENTPHMCTDNSLGTNTVPKLITVSTELNIGSSQSENLSTDSPSSVHSVGMDSLGTQCCSSTKVGATSFLLFGKIIHLQPVESVFDDIGCTEDEGSRGYNETETETETETEGINNPQDLCLTYRKFLDR